MPKSNLPNNRRHRFRWLPPVICTQGPSRIAGLSDSSLSPTSILWLPPLSKVSWWRTTPVATKTRYHGAGGAHLRARIYPLIFISLLRTFDPYVFKRVLVYFPLLFWLSGGFFPFRDPIREAISLCGPLFFYEYF